jgi:hypothetical protein
LLCEDLRRLLLRANVGHPHALANFDATGKASAAQRAHDTAGVDYGVAGVEQGPDHFGVKKRNLTPDFFRGHPRSLNSQCSLALRPHCELGQLILGKGDFESARPAKVDGLAGCVFEF